MPRTATTPPPARRRFSSVSNFFRSHESSTEDVLDHEVTENTDHIGAASVGAVDDVAELRDAVERRPHMKIGQDGDPHGSVRRPAQADSFLDDSQTRWLEPERRQPKHDRCTCSRAQGGLPGSSSHLPLKYEAGEPVRETNRADARVLPGRSDSLARCRSSARERRWSPCGVVPKERNQAVYINRRRPVPTVPRHREIKQRSPAIQDLDVLPP